MCAMIPGTTRIPVHRALFLLVAIASCAYTTPRPGRVAPGTRPNIVLIVSDDQGYGDVSCFGGDIPTPALDRLAREGARLTQFYVAAPVCTPSRYALFTGRHPLRARGGLDRVGMMLDASHATHGLREGERTLGELLQDAGYETALVGKWHLGHGAPEHLPTRHGFDSFHGLAGGCVDYFTHRYGTVADWYRGEEPLAEEGYATDLLTEAAIRFLTERDDERPFLLVLAYTAPHYGKSLAGDADAETLATSDFGDPRVDERTGEAVQLVNSLQAPEKWLARFEGVDDPKRRYYAAMVASMDAGIGRVLDALDETGLARDTLVFFTPDHGADGTRSSAGSNAPLRGGKHSLWDGGLRVPAIVRWPGRVAAGTELEQLSSALDLVPTLAGVARADVSELELDGIDLVETWTAGARRERELLWQQGASQAYRRGKWKLVGNGLYDLDADPVESTDVAEREPGRLEELKTARDARLAALEARR